MIEALKILTYLWLGSILFFLLKDAVDDFLEHLRILTDEELSRKKENLGYVLIGSAFFGLLVGINTSTPELEFAARTALAVTFGIIGLKLIKGE